MMIGWPSPVSDAARALLAPPSSAVPQVPRITGRDDVLDKVKALSPDVIIDYGNATGRYAELARTTQQRTGVPTILLDGAIDRIPETFRTLGAALGRAERGAQLAAFAEALLALPPRQNVRPKVMYARGDDGLTAIVPTGDLAETFARLGWQPVAPPAEAPDQGPFRRTTIDAVRQLDPDLLLFADPAMREGLSKEPGWKTVRAVQAGNAVVAPSLPFGWIEDPPSINRLLGLAWLKGYDATLLAATFNAVVYGHALTQTELAAVLGERTSP